MAVNSTNLSGPLRAIRLSLMTSPQHLPPIDHVAVDSGPVSCAPADQANYVAGMEKAGSVMGAMEAIDAHSSRGAILDVTKSTVEGHVKAVDNTRAACGAKSRY